jgi:phenylalanyl-tRNA synthetase beta chain
MKVSARTLRRFCSGAPEDPKQLRALLDDLGIEVKRLELSAGDAILTLELLANRGDHHCYVGVAREIAARTGSELVLPPRRTLERGEPPLPLRIESDKCLLYTATPLHVTGGLARSLGSEATALLNAAGLYTGNAAIDVTNLVNLELGQPSHAFDRARIAGKICVRLSLPGERAWLLFTPEPRELPPSTLVIADDEKVLAIAGVIGCEESKIQDDTREIVLESAAFDPVSVRIAARALAVHTDAAARFERGSDPTLAAVAAERIALLLEQAGAAQISGALGSAGAWRDPERVVTLRLGELERFFERRFDEAEVTARLAAYGFENLGEGRFRVPPHRLWDVESEEDLFEELARSIGFNALPEGLPIARGSLPSRREILLDTAEAVLIGAGFFEVYTDGFYGRHMLDKLDLPEGSPLAPHVETVNALDKGFSLLKNNCLAQATQTIADNSSVKAQQVRLYEWTRTFHPDSSAPNGVCRERDMLWAVCSGPERATAWDSSARDADVFFLKGVVEHLRSELDLALEIAVPDPAYPIAPLLHPTRSMSLRLDGRSVGAVGEISPAVLQAFGIKFSRASYFEIEQAALLAEPRGRPSFEVPPAVPDIDRMLSFSVPAGISVKEILPLLRGAAPEWLSCVEVADVFEGKGNEAVRAVAFRLWFNAREARTHEQLNEACAKVASNVVSHFGARGVEQR